MELFASQAFASTVLVRTSEDKPASERAIVSILDYTIGGQSDRFYVRASMTLSNEKGDFADKPALSVELSDRFELAIAGDKNTKIFGSSNSKAIVKSEEHLTYQALAIALIPLMDEGYRAQVGNMAIEPVAPLLARLIEKAKRTDGKASLAQDDVIDIFSEIAAHDCDALQGSKLIAHARDAKEIIARRSRPVTTIEPQQSDAA